MADYRVLSLFAKAALRNDGVSRCVEIFRSAPYQQQQLIKDEVVFSQDVDRLALLREASERVQAGQSVFHIGTLHRLVDDREGNTDGRVLSA